MGVVLWGTIFLFENPAKTDFKLRWAPINTFEKGSNFVQKSRPHRTFLKYRGKSFLFALTQNPQLPPHRLRPQQTAKETHKTGMFLFSALAVSATFFCGRHGKKQLTVVSAEQARNQKRFLPVFQFYPLGEMRPDKLNRRYKQSSPMLCVQHIGLVGNGGCK